MLKKCLLCGEEFDGHKLARYCGAKCKSYSKRLRDGTIAKDRKCAKCGCKFKGKSARDFVCSDCKVSKVENISLSEKSSTIIRDYNIKEIDMITDFLSKKC